MDNNQINEQNAEDELENDTANFNYTNNFQNLRQYEESDCAISIIKIPESLHKEMCFTENCVVSMNRFNVAYNLEQKLRNQYKTEATPEKIERRINKYGYYYYKKYYEPREEWRRRQYLHNWMFRQIEYQYRISPKLVKLEEDELESESSADESNVSELNDSVIDMELEQTYRSSFNPNSEEVLSSEMSAIDSQNFFKDIAVTSTQNH